MQASTLSNTQAKCGHEMAVTTQNDVDAAFADMEHLLALERPVPLQSTNTCIGCGGSNFVYNGSGSGHPGSRVCDTCGVVDSCNVYWETMYGNTLQGKPSNYKRIHHWHERISQLLLMESAIPNEQMLQIGQKLCDGTYNVINKDSIRAVLRSLNMQLYIEKWLQIIFRITGIQPPCPGPLVVRQLDDLFQELQRPFDSYKMPNRKNFLNYNYVFCRLFQKMDCAQFSMFFPLIKSKTKLKALDNMWSDMVRCLNWDVTPLASVAPFAVQLEQPALLLQRLGSQCAMTVPAVIETKPLRMVFQKSDRRHANNSKQPLKRPHSDLLEPEFQRLGLLRKRLR